jgi:hypothetical protein
MRYSCMACYFLRVVLFKSRGPQQCAGTGVAMFVMHNNGQTVCQLSAAREKFRAIRTANQIIRVRPDAKSIQRCEPQIESFESTS